MTEEEPKAEPASKQRLPRPNWDFYLKNRNATLHDAIALSLNVSPARIDGLAAERTAKVGIFFRNRLRAARLEMPVDCAIEVVEEGRENDGSDWIVDLKSFVTFALARGWGRKLEKFQLLGAESPFTNSVKNDVKELKAPVAFVAALIQVLVAIASRAATDGKKFNVQEMPGQKRDFYELARKFDKEFSSTDATLSTYMKNLCQFKQGARQTDFYRDLFPETFCDRK